MASGRKDDRASIAGTGRVRRVVARGVRRREIDYELLVQALLLIAKDLERDEEARRDTDEVG